jgi:hypothetical protein
VKGFTRIMAGVAGIACAITTTTIPMAQAVPDRPVAVAQYRAATQVAAPAASTTVLVNCHGNGEVKPPRFVVSCPDRRNVLLQIQWRSWRTRDAFGIGTDAIDNCQPTCVAGHYQKFPVIVLAWGTGSLPNGHRVFRHLTIVFTQPRLPAHMPRFLIIQLTKDGPA